MVRQVTVAVLSVGLLVGAAPMSVRRAAAVPPWERPNILIILTDDQPAQPEAYQVMPKTMEVFGAGGTHYPNGVVTTPLCCPSRASIFTGQYVHNHGVIDLHSAHAMDTTHTIQATLKAHGYQTAIAGKYLNHAYDPPPYFDRWATFAERPEYNDASFNVDGALVETNRYSTTFIRRRSLRFLSDFEASDSSPWFMQISPNAPHKPATPQRKYADAPVPAWITNPARDEDDLSDKPDFIVSFARDDPRPVKRLRRKQLRTLMSVDDLVGAVFARLEELGEADNTLAVFLSDNGFFWYEHRLGAGKRLAYDEAVNVPFFVRWPGRVEAGAVDPKVVANIDIAPTAYDAARVRPQYTVDGRSMFESQRGEMFLEDVDPDERYPKWHSLWSPGSTYIRYYESEGEPREHYEADDPWQLENVYQDGIEGNEPLNQDFLDELLKQYATCAGETCP
jgi:arylsulfatase A-like enzyme